MKNIILITTIYPLQSNNKGTPVCHYFAKEWVEMGYNVKVFHVQNVYPIYYYWIAKLFTKYIISKTGAVVYTKRDKGDEFILDNVNVNRIPVFKSKPHGKSSKKSINNFISNIIEINKRDDFVPDIILGHFPNPQLEIVSRLKDYYHNAISSIIMHGDNLAILNNFKHTYKDLFRRIDIWGYRSKPIQNNFEKIYGVMNKSFICYSGIPEQIVLNSSKKNFENNKIRYIYVGEMIKRKYPVSVLNVLYKMYSKDFQLTYIGDGHELKEISDKVEKFDLKDKVQILGKIKREKILNYLDDSECFIMISKGEAFGLVYLEAMARGCITIASRDEGIDGVIIDGYNGFLCKAGDEHELEKILLHINNLSLEDKLRISNNAIETAKNLTDRKVAEHYINSVINAK